MSEPNPFLSSGTSSPAAAGAGGEARAVDAGQGWAWIAKGFELFKKQPGIWIVIVVLLFVIMMVLAFIPILGALATFLLMPVFTGGLMLGCRSLARDGTLEINHLFAGFSTQTGNLFVLGAISIGAWIVVMLPVLAIVGVGAFFGASHGGAAGMGGMGASFLLAFLIVFALSIVIYMALWFAPALVVFRGAAPVAAPPRYGEPAPFIGPAFCRCRTLSDSLAVTLERMPSRSGVMIGSCLARITTSHSGSNFFQPAA